MRAKQGFPPKHGADTPGAPTGNASGKQDTAKTDRSRSVLRSRCPLTDHWQEMQMHAVHVITVGSVGPARSSCGMEKEALLQCGSCIILKSPSQWETDNTWWRRNFLLQPPDPLFNFRRLDCRGIYHCWHFPREKSFAAPAKPRNGDMKATEMRESFSCRSSSGRLAKYGASCMTA